MGSGGFWCVLVQFWWVLVGFLWVLVSSGVVWWVLVSSGAVLGLFGFGRLW